MIELVSCTLMETLWNRQDRKYETLPCFLPYSDKFVFHRNGNGNSKIVWFWTEIKPEVEAGSGRVKDKECHTWR